MKTQSLPLPTKHKPYAALLLMLLCVKEKAPKAQLPEKTKAMGEPLLSRVIYVREESRCRNIWFFIGQ
ncbi:hypothetical protein [Chitinophaga sp. Cy-1792]|uniref:hypothetical protein n=1 Tax=Chitinophaga sp. Cy-1792 TaxID=2608339 RepID=UPI001420D92A|nr:hypothetical protein [Chitinophaga sp. Cy-1792]NIG52787.1 hypothetical protein [Chitinophaga sp. Cy-1792]